MLIASFFLGAFCTLIILGCSGVMWETPSWEIRRKEAESLAHTWEKECQYWRNRCEEEERSKK